MASGKVVFYTRYQTKVLCSSHGSIGATINPVGQSSRTVILADKAQGG